MLDKKYVQSIREDLLSYAQKRREIIKMSGDAQQHSKKAIFALQRDDKAGCEERLKLAEGIFVDLYKKFKTDKDLFDEGSFKAAVEDYVEAIFFYNYKLMHILLTTSSKKQQIRNTKTTSFKCFLYLYYIGAKKYFYRII